MKKGGKKREREREYTSSDERENDETPLPPSDAEAKRKSEITTREARETAQWHVCVPLRQFGQYRLLAFGMFAVVKLICEATALPMRWRRALCARRAGSFVTTFPARPVRTGSLLRVRF